MSSLTLRRTLFLLSCVVGVGCGASEDKGIDGDDGTPDAATTDSGLDESETADLYHLEGMLASWKRRDGRTICDANVALTGTPYTGDCMGCDFAFAIEGTVTSYESTEECSDHPGNLMVGSGDYYLAFFYYLNALHTTYDGYSYALTVGTGTEDGISWSLLAYNYSYSTYGYYYEDYHNVSLDEDALTWSDSPEYPTEEREWREEVRRYCTATGLFRELDPLMSPAGAHRADGEVACQQDYGVHAADMWALELTGGDRVSIVVDATDDEMAWDLQLWLNDSSGCTIHGFYEYELDSFPCSGDGAWLCPMVRFVAPSTDTFQLGVTAKQWQGNYGMDACPERVPYELIIDATSDPSLTLVGDDVEQYETTGVNWRHYGAVTLTPVK